MTGRTRLSPATTDAIANHAAALADQWPPLTDEQLTRVGALLRDTDRGGDAAA